MIREKFNLKCSAGHYHYSPNPNYWAGMICNKPFGNPVRDDGRTRISIEKCMKPMAKVRRAR